MPQYQIFVSTVTVFENEGVSDNTGESVFQFLVRYGCIKSGKIKRLDACYTVESWRFKMYKLRMLQNVYRKIVKDAYTHLCIVHHCNEFEFLLDLSLSFLALLVETSRAYAIPCCLSVRPSVRPSVRLSIRKQFLLSHLL